jgi:hypothetical protein
MTRRLLHLLTALSLLLCLAACVLWVRSFWLFEGWCWFDANHHYFQLSSIKGAVWLHRIAPVPTGFNIRPRFFRIPLTVGSVPPTTLGFHVSRASPGQWTVAVPYWSIFLLTALAPATDAARRVSARYRRVRPGACRHCGYDLRATPERCPECGTPALLGQEIG